MADRTHHPSLICPVSDISFFESAITLILDTGYDALLPWEERLYKLAGAAVGFALRIGCDYPEEIEGLLSSHERDRTATGTDDDAEQFLSAFTSPAMQGGIMDCAREVGAPALAVLVLVLVRYARSLATMGAGSVELETARRMTGFLLRSLLLLARDHPALARTYRDLVSG